MSNYGEWQESKKEYKQEKRKERQKGQLKALKWFAIIVIPLFILLLIGLGTGAIKPQSAQNASSETEQNAGKQDFTPLAQKYKSKTPFKVLYRVDGSRYYYIQQTKGAVTNQSADEIIKELYAKEAWAENGGTLGSVVIFDSSHKLVEGKKPSLDLDAQAEYSSKQKKITVGDKVTNFEPAKKK
ncbi:hypothetical protein D3C74_296000 [compost metagenome]